MTPRDQAVADGLLIQLLRCEDKPVMATAHIYNDFKDMIKELIDVFHKFKVMISFRVV